MEFQKILTERNLRFAAPIEEECDITDFDKMEEMIDRIRPDIIINCSAYNAVDEAEEESELAYLVNSSAVENLAALCRKNNIFLVHFSSDYVFDGKKDNLYKEEDEVNPLSMYGKSKLQGEQAVLGNNARSLVFRLSWVIGKGQQNFLFKLRQWAKKSPVLKISADEVSAPTFTETVVDVTLKALSKELSGLYHLTNSGYASRYELAKYYIQYRQMNNLIIPVPMSTFKTKAKRPGFSAMSNAKLSTALGITILDWKEALRRYVDQSGESK